jgi:hypothetical protein
MAAPPNIVAHKPHFHRNMPWKEPLRCVSAANIGLLDYARSATATSSAGTASLGNDGNDATLVHMSWTGGQYLNYDLGSPTAIYAWRTYENGQRQGFYVQSSPDDATWTTQGSLPGTGSGSGTRDSGVVSFGPVTARYWRITNSTFDGGSWDVGTFSLFADGIDLIPGVVVDGVTVVAGDRVLLTAQTAGQDNGIYTVQASGPPVRAYDMDVDAEIIGASMFCTAGTVYAGTFWYCSNSGSPVLGTTPLTFRQEAVTGVPVGPAGGDLSGTYPNPGVAQIHGSPVGVITSPAVADRLRWNGTAWVNSGLAWVPMTVWDGSNWVLLVDGSGNAIMAEV